MNIIKVEYDDIDWIEPIEFGIEYLGIGKRIDIYKAIESMENINKELGKKSTIDMGKLEDTDYIDNTMEELEYIAGLNAFKVGTVGYSQWSYYIALDDIEYSFINDLWEGINWYWLQYIKDGKEIDSIGGCYITNEDDLKQCIEDNFIIDDYYLVDNYYSQYFDNFKKVKEIKHITYSYKEV